jgi:hypothetical protein
MASRKRDVKPIWEAEVGDRALGHAHFWERALSRRQFVGGTARLGGLVAGSALGWPEMATAVPAGNMFPTTPVLDSFTRPNAPTLGPNWLGAQEGHKQLAIINDRAGCAIWDIGADIWAPGGSIATEGPDCEVYCTIPKIASGTGMCITLYARVQGSALASTVSAYLLQITSGPRVRLYYCLNGRIPTTKVIPLSRWSYQKTSDGDKWGLSCVGNAISAWYGPGGVWQSAPIISATDSHLPAAGGIMVSVGYDCRITDFGGGTRP